MPDQPLLERIYQRCEFNPAYDVRMQVVGALLRSVLGAGRLDNPAHDKLVDQLVGIDIEPRL